MDKPFPDIGAAISHYRVISKLGAGGMGEVYLAQDTQLGRAVALKILPAGIASDQKRMQRFVQEAKAASALNHPNILTIYEFGESEGLQFLATELVEGESLYQRILGERLEIREALDIGIQVASALATAHAAGIIHRDIKPENIMCRHDGIVKVLDFGLAKVTESHAMNTDPEAPTVAPLTTQPGVAMGTVNYMSPEQTRGLKVDARTDIWSLGVVLYEMLARERPFAGDTASDVIAAILKSEPPSLMRGASKVPAELERIVSKALRKDKEERYQVVKDLSLDLKSLKQRLEFDTELERTGVSGRNSDALWGTASGGKSIAGKTVATLVGQTEGVSHDNQRATNVGSTPGEIKRHRPGAWLVPTMLVAATIAIAYFAYSRYFAESRNPNIDSIAVLPFVNQNPEADTDYLSDGFTESTINSLAQLPNLRVIARSSVFLYKGKQIDPLTAGKELGVRSVLTGRIMQRGDALTVSVELMDVQFNKQLWGERYERQSSDLLAVQREIAREISGNLRLKLSGAEQGRVTRHYTESPEAYHLYLKGRFYWNKRTGEALKKSIEYFNQAIEKDPHYALAYAGLADSYVLLPGYSGGSPQDSYPKAKAAAKKALEIDDTLAEAHASLGSALFLHDWNFAESNREFQLAIQLNPNYAVAHHWYGGNLLVMGRFNEAIAEMKLAQELDPLSLIINAELGNTYLYARQFDPAVEQLRKTIEMDQNFYYAHYCLGMANVMKGSFEEGLVEYQKARQLSDDTSVLALIAHALAASGKREQALRALLQLKQTSSQRYVPAYSFATVYAGLGDKDQAFQWLEKSYQGHEGYVTILGIDPFFDNLRSDARFADLVRRVGLPQ